MSTPESLALLVSSLTKGEKRYLTLYSSIQQGEKDYVFLLDCLEKGLDMKNAKKALSEKKPGASFDVTSRYLYNLILDCILQIQTKKNRSIKLTNELLKAQILFEKGLYNDGFKLLEKIQLAAEKLELPEQRLLAAKAELSYICSLNFHNITEVELVQKQMKIQGYLREHQHYNQHNSLYQLLQHRLLYKGGVRTIEQKQELNDLLMTEVNLVGKRFAETFESQKTHLLFQAYYFITIGGYKSALTTFYELNQLFEEHEHLWAQTPMDYLLTVEGILDSLHTIRKYQEANYFIDKLKLLNPPSGFAEITIQRIIFTYTVIMLLNAGEFSRASLLHDEYTETLFKKLKLLDLNKQAELYLYTSLIYVGMGKMEKAHLYLNRILFESKLYYTLPVYRTFRLIHLLVHFELGNHDYIRHEIRSIKRSLTGNYQKSYLLERIIFQFVQMESLPFLQKERALLWERINAKFEKIKSDKFEIQLLKIFNFSAWIESKLLKKSFADLLKGRHNDGYFVEP